MLWCMLRQAIAADMFFALILLALHMPSQVYQAINNGVYRAGFATSQAGYEAAVGEMHQLLAALDVRLGQQRFLLGDRCVEAEAAPC